MSQSVGILVYAGLIVVVGIVVVGYFILSLRRRNRPDATSNLAGKPNIPRDPTMKREGSIEDNAGNYSRKVVNNPDPDK